MARTMWACDDHADMRVITEPARPSKDGGAVQAGTPRTHQAAGCRPSRQQMRPRWHGASAAAIGPIALPRPCLRSLETSNVAVGHGLAVAVHDQLAALILHGYVTAVADGGANVEDRLDLLALESLGVASGSAGIGVVFALGPKHRSVPAAGRRGRCSEPAVIVRCMAPGKHLVKMVSKFKCARGGLATG